MFYYILKGLAESRCGAEQENFGGAVQTWVPRLHPIAQNWRDLKNLFSIRFILDLAAHTDGIVLSNDNYRDLQNEKQAKWQDLLNFR